MRTLIALPIVLVASICFAQPAGPAPADSRITAVTVYQGTALVTREVAIPQGRGQFELVVWPLPPQTVDSSLYTEGNEGVRILSTRYRTRAVREDTRAEVQAKELEIRQLQEGLQRMERDIAVIEQNQSMLNKLESFTTVTMTQLAERGLLSSQATIELTRFVMDDRAAQAGKQVELQQEAQRVRESIALAQRELRELSAGASRTERDALIVLEKTADAPATVRLNYLVNAANWRAQYRIRGNGPDQPVQIEYLAAIEQQSGEDWTDAVVVLSNAQPMLNADPPDLLALNVSVAPHTSGAPAPAQPAAELHKASRGMRELAQREYNRDNRLEGRTFINQAAGLDQAAELFADRDSALSGPNRRIEGPTVTYHLATRHTVPSRADQQLIEIARLQLAAEHYYKAVPVLTPHVYRLASLINTSEHILLDGEATMYLGSDFVGRMRLPLVAIGEQVTLAFGVDPQLQVERELTDRISSVQGGNQVHVYDYRIRISSFKDQPVRLELWDRLPHADSQVVAVNVISTSAPLSQDPDYLRTQQPKNLLRWDLTIPANARGQEAQVLTYQFKLEHERSVALTGFQPTAR